MWKNTLPSLQQVHGNLENEPLQRAHVASQLFNMNFLRYLVWSVLKCSTYRQEQSTKTGLITTNNEMVEARFQQDMR